jgi:hypothetical protein
MLLGSRSVVLGAIAHARFQEPQPHWRITMGDKSPKSKQRDQKQKDATKAQGASNAKAKQQSQSSAAAATTGKKK